MKLQPHQIDKPWGRNEIPHVFGPTHGRRIGEIAFTSDGEDDLPLLTKYIFTSETLSVQVHPNDVQAAQRNLPNGKTECWYVLDADPGATIGIGLKQCITAAQLRSSALDASIEDLIDWQTVAPGDFYYIPAGTIHAIGAGISLLEFQQNADVTYRLYDYGRPRQLHLDDAIAVSNLAPYPASLAMKAGGPLDAVLRDGPLFTLVRATNSDWLPPRMNDRTRWVMPLEGIVRAGGDHASSGECLLVDPGVALEFDANSLALIGHEGPL